MFFLSPFRGGGGENEGFAGAPPLMDGLLPLALPLGVVASVLIDVY